MNQDEYNIINQSEYFNSEYYLSTNLDVLESKVDPLSHYIQFGENELRNPSDYFSVKYYLENNPDVASNGMSPLLHFILFGEKELRKPTKDFSPRFYLEKNNDVKSNGIKPLRHYIKYGQFEKREYIQNYYYVNYGHMVHHIDIFKELEFTIVNEDEIPSFDNSGVIVFLFPYKINEWSNRLLRRCKEKEIKIIFIVMDLYHLYYDYNPPSKESEFEMLQNADFIISQSEKMTEYLNQNNLKVPIINHEIFDYYIKENSRLSMNNYKLSSEFKKSVVYAGSSGDRNRRFIFDYEPQNYNLNVFTYEKFKSKLNLKNRFYKGWFSPDTIPYRIHGDFGILWNGDEKGDDLFFFKQMSLSSKLGLYISSGIPIICKKGSADAYIVEKYRIGFSIESLNELEHILPNFSLELYEDYQKNLNILQSRTQSGYYFKKAFNEILELK